MTNALTKKKEIIKKIEGLGIDVDFKESFGILNSASEEFKNAGYAGEDNDSLYREFSNAKNSFFIRLRDYRTNIENSKKSLIDEINSLEYSKESSARLAEIKSEYKSLGYCSKDIDNDLYQSFNRAISVYYDKGKKLSGESKRKKELLILELSNIVLDSTMYKHKSRVKEISEEFKSLGYAGSENKTLTDNFYNLTKEFWSKSSEEYEKFLERKKQQTEALERKEALIRDLSNIHYSDNPPEHMEEVKGLIAKFKESGFASKEDNKRLSDEFYRLTGLFFDEVKRYWDNRRRDRIDSLYKSINKDEEYIRRLEDNISNLHSKINNLNPNWRTYYEAKSNYESYISDNESKISEVRERIRNKHDKLGELFAKL